MVSGLDSSYFWCSGCCAPLPFEVDAQRARGAVPPALLSPIGAPIDSSDFYLLFALFELSRLSTGLFLLSAPHPSGLYALLCTVVCVLANFHLGGAKRPAEATGTTSTEFRGLLVPT